MIEINNKLRISKICAAGIFQNEVPSGFLNGAYDRIEAVFVNSGKITVTSGKQIFECKAGTGAIFNTGEMHYIKLSADEYAEYVLVSFELEGEALSGAENKITKLTVLQKQLILSICNQLTEDGEYNKISPSVLLENSAIICKLATALEFLILDIELNTDAVSLIDTSDAQLFGLAVEEMKNNALGQLSVEGLAERLEISISHLKRIFATYTNVGAHEYFMGLKIEAAKKMLRSGLSVTETSEKTGFNNQNYFSAAFKRITGISPKEYSGVKFRKATVEKKVRIIEKEEVLPKARVATDMPSYLL